MKSTALPVTHKERVSFARAAFKKSFFSFLVDCLGNDKLYTPHEEWCAEVQEAVIAYERREPGYTKRFLNLMPRGTYKSTIFTVGLALWMLARNPNLRIMVFSGNEKNSKNFLHEAKKHMTLNPRFRSCFGKWEEGADRWTETYIVISKRTAAKKEPSILAVGKGTEITSMHFDVLLLDDLVTREDRDSPVARASSISVLGDLESIMDDTSIIFCHGTHWHYADAYMHIRKTLNPELVIQGKQPWKCRVESPYESDGKTERFKRIIPDLEDRKIKVGLVTYYANYENNPLPPETQLFSEESLSYFDMGPDHLIATRYTYWDPASTEVRPGRDPDYHAMVTIAAGEYYDVIDVWMKQDKPSVGYDRAMELARGLNISHFRVETNHLPDGADNLEEKFRTARIPAAVSGEKNTISKATRIESLEPYTTMGRIRFRRDWRDASPSYRLFMEQLTMYPVASHDDGPDALEGCYRLAVDGGFESAEAVEAGADGSESGAALSTDSIWSSTENAEMEAFLSNIRNNY